MKVSLLTSHNPKTKKLLQVMSYKIKSYKKIRRQWQSGLTNYKLKKSKKLYQFIVQNQYQMRLLNVEGRIKFQKSPQTGGLFLLMQSINFHKLHTFPADRSNYTKIRLICFLNVSKYCKRQQSTLGRIQIKPIFDPNKIYSF